MLTRSRSVPDGAPLGAETPRGRPALPAPAPDSHAERLQAWLEHLPSEVTAHSVRPARLPRTVAWPSGIHEDVRRALASRGIEQPFSHQARAMEHALAGRDVVVVTPTASGKSLCYVAPVLSRCLAEPDARSLWLFPTKALSLDQVASARELCQLLAVLSREGQGFNADPVGPAGQTAPAGQTSPEIPVSTFDGDTPADERRAVRERARIVVTNPDMLHAGILPQHARWARLLGGLRFIVVDELHAYRGVFGSHVANVLRRLLRLAEFHGARPVVIACSATLANAQAHAEALVGRSVTVVDDDGSPAGERHVVFVDPAVISTRAGARGSALGAARRAALRAIVAGLRTIVFATSRLSVELLSRSLQDALARGGRDPALVEAYRGGLLPSARRGVQERLRNGQLMAVVSTHALELGLDVGSLDVAILCGYPGSIASTWQQAGRAGRRGAPSASLFIARNTPVDRFLVRHPEYLLEASPEHARLDASNLLVLVDHVKCAAFELPFRRGDGFGSEEPERVTQILDLFAEEGLVHRDASAWYWTEESHPAQAVSLRSVSSDNILVVDTTGETPRVIAETDFTSAPTTLHEKAIFFVSGRQHHVDRFDHAARRAFVRAVDVDYYTDAMTRRTVAVLEAFEQVLAPEAAGTGAASGLVSFRHGEVRLSRKVIGFKKVQLETGENLGYGDVTLPEQELHVTAAWLTLEEAACRELSRLGLSRPGMVEALAGAGRALRAMASVIAACDPRDLGMALGDPRGAGASDEARPVPAGGDLPADSAFEPTLFLHENLPGGTGLAPLLFDARASLLAGALALVQGCRCGNGCPACVGPESLAGAGCKPAAVQLLGLLHGATVATATTPPA